MRVLHIVFLVVFLANVLAFDEAETSDLIKKMIEKNSRIQKLQLQLSMAEKRTKQFENKYVELLGQNGATCNQDRSLRDRLTTKISQLEGQVKSLIQRGKTVADQYLQKISDLEYEILKKEKKYLADIADLKNHYEAKIKDQIKEKLNPISNSISEKEAECRHEANQFKERVKQLEQAAGTKARQFAEKVQNARVQAVTRIKNFLTGKGPYTKQDQQSFSEFKQRVSGLEEKIKDKLSEIDRIKKEKQDIQFEQRYCKAKLTNYDEEIKELENEAAAKGKGYYVEELKRLQKQRINQEPLGTTGELYVAYQQKIAATQEKLRVQLEENHRLYEQKREAEEKVEESERKIDEMRRRQEQNQSQIWRLNSQIKELRNLIKEIYELKDR